MSEIQHALQAFPPVLGAIALWALAIALGRATGRFARLNWASRVEGLVLSASLGFGILSYAAFFLGIAGLLRTPVIVSVLVVLCTCAVAMERHAWKGPRREGPPAKTIQEPIAGWSAALLSLGLIVWATALLGSATPIGDYDGFTYHVAAPKRWLELGAMRPLPTQLLAEWPMGFEMLTMLLLPITGPDSAKPLLCLSGLLAAAATYGLGRRIAGHTTGAAAAGLFLLAAGIDKFDTTSVEAGYALFVVSFGLSIAAAWQARDAADRRKWLVVAAVMAGLAACVKLNGLVAVLAGAGVVFATPDERRADWGARLVRSLLFAAAAVVVASPWYLRTWRDTGNPFFPFAYSLLGGRDWNAGASRVLQTYYHCFNLPGATIAARSAVVTRHLLKLTAILGAALLVPGPRWSRALLLLSGGYALLQISVCDQWRFLLPALPFAAVVAAWWIARSAARLQAAGWVATAACLAYLAGPTARAARDAAKSLTRESRTELRQRLAGNYHACAWANRNLPGNARVLLGLDSRGYYLERECLWSHAIFQQRIRYETPEAFEASLRSSGVTHLVLNRGMLMVPELQFEIGAGWRRAEVVRLRELAARSKLLATLDGVEVYDIRQAQR